ncbi:MAG: TetR family transcriptional regulator [Burkholderiales bacterium]|nr:TetR family transcriptional regulator [Burkholderiales bacterium]
MAKRTKEQAEQTREALLDAAERVFHAKGVGRASLDDIAQEAGVTRGAVYWHFKNKGDVFTAMCDRVALPWEAMLAALAADPGDDPVGGLIRNSVNVLTQVANDERTMRVFEIMMFKTELCDVVAEVMEQEAERARKCRLLLEEVLRAAQAKGQMPPELDCKLAAFAANSFVVGCIREWLELRDIDLTERAPWLMTSFFAGLRVCPAPPSH